MRDRNRLAILLLQLLSLAILTGISGLAQSSVSETFSTRSPGHFDRLALQQEQQDLHSWLVSRQVPSGLRAPLVVDMTAEDLQQEESSASSGRTKVGVAKQVGIEFGFPEAGKSQRLSRATFVPYGALRSQAGNGYVWTALVRSEGARALRLHFTDFNLPRGAALYVYSQTRQAFGPYTGLGPFDEGEFWSDTVFGSEIIVQLHYTPVQGIKPSPPVFQIAEVNTLGPQFQIAPDPQSAADQGACHDGQGDGCLFNVNCTNPSSTVQRVQDAVAMILFQSGPFLYVCSGGLLNDTDDSSFNPFLLTANHCISRGKEARSVEAFFQFEVGCQESCQSWNAGFPSVRGASLLSTASSTDHTLLLLDRPAPGGSVFLGWNANAVAFSDGEGLFRVSHPHALPQAYSEHSVDTGAPTCSNWPRGPRIYSHDEFGSTEGGSSGSPVFNQSGQVVGQLSGACGYNVSNSCDSVNNATVDGAFAAYYDKVQQWLNPSSGGGSGSGGGGGESCQLGQKGDSCSADNQCCSGKCRGKACR